MSDPDRRLVDEARRGDDRALAELYERHRRPLFGFLCRMLRRPEAEEVLQEVWIKVMESIERYEPGGAGFRSWLYKVAANAARDRIRREKLRSGPSLDAPLGEEGGEAAIDRLVDSGAGPDRKTEGSLFRDELERAMEALTPRQRAAVLLKHQQGFHYREIAEMLQMAEGTAKTTVHRGVATLRDRLQEWFNG